MTIKLTPQEDKEIDELCDYLLQVIQAKRKGSHYTTPKQNKGLTHYATYLETSFKVTF